MKPFLKLLRYAGLAVFGIAIVLLVITLLNFVMNFSEVHWFEIYFARLYLFLAIVGILAYILVRFRRRKED
ncbi:hypothetical protein [Planococcus salinus]|uniref:Uncharacterized protein n=1 Tax=Planococcus salinus TaxID=1848460 RepID=A0A3M8P7J2_9BACL|nr:hypothetical protein [Planococcus salinus]RNF39659.1 hypothetical protein EEX84_06705 [Planococcus salinus]